MTATRGESIDIRWIEGTSVLSSSQRSDPTTLPNSASVDGALSSTFGGGAWQYLLDSAPTNNQIAFAARMVNSHGNGPWSFGSR